MKSSMLFVNNASPNGLEDHLQGRVFKSDYLLMDRAPLAFFFMSNIANVVFDWILQFSNFVHMPQGPLVNGYIFNKSHECAGWILIIFNGNANVKPSGVMILDFGHATSVMLHVY